MKRVLIITYYWPPAGGPGVQRWLYFVKYFREFGIEPVVYIPENAHYPLQDDSFVSEVPKDVEIISQPVKEPYRFAKWFSKKKTKEMSSGIISKSNQSFVEKILLYIRGNFFIPDARVGWVKPSVLFLTSYLEKNPVDAIVTTGPPHSLHLIGLQLQRELKLPWVADFRDPWTTIHYHASLRLTEAAKKKHKRLEAKVLQHANAITVTSPSTKEEFKTITQTPIHLITNGYEVTKEATVTRDRKFSLAHIGSLLSNRNPLVLWEVLAELANELETFKDDLEIVLAGVIGDAILDSISSFGLTSNTRNMGYVSHKEALQLQNSAQILLLLEIDSPETRVIIPGKLFEYLQTKRPIVAIGPQGSDIQPIMDETSSGTYFTPSEKVALKQQIGYYYDLYKKGGVPSSAVNVSKFSRKNLTQKMADILKSL